MQAMHLVFRNKCYIFEIIGEKHFLNDTSHVLRIVIPSEIYPLHYSTVFKLYVLLQEYQTKVLFLRLTKY